MGNRVDKPHYIKIFFLFFIFLLFIPAFRFFAGQICYQQAQRFIRQQSYQRAVDILQKGSGWLPWDSRLQHRLGVLYFMLSHTAGVGSQDTFLSFALEHLKKATQLNPLEPTIAASLAYVIEFQKGSKPDEILAAYQRVVDLSPNTVQYLMLYADKLYAFKRQKKLTKAVQRLGRIYPGRYGVVRRKPYWNEKLERSFAEGLLQAIQENTDPRKARIALADIQAQQHNWADAAEQYRLALLLKQHTNTSNNYFKLATYYLHANTFEPAYQAITAGLKKQQAGPINLQYLFSLFQRTGHGDLFLEFYLHISSELSFSYAEDIRLAELLIKYKKYTFALELLNKVVTERDYLAKPWLLLAKIYRSQGRSEAMKRASQKGKSLLGKL
ncbi:MAG: hypothetical protein D3918_02400 [Candidatus Electrothrix sp. AX2]|nr:hypothetical protein [Candidatus Electrothrix gigas]